jgi:hypothetical protein
MGSCNFSNTVLVKGGSSEAYNQACKEAREYNGHQDGYSGDIQTTCGFTDKTSTAPKYGTKAFEKWEDEMLDKLGKRECVCVEITGTKLKKLKSRRYKGKRGIRGFYFFGWAAE